MTPESPQRLAQHRAWYTANGERHRARRRARYAADPQPGRDSSSAYRGTAAGMLSTIRDRAKRRKA